MALKLTRKLDVWMSRLRILSLLCATPSGSYNVSRSDSQEHLSWRNHGLEAVYGDTDSVFVNLNQNSVEEALRIAHQFK